MNAGSKRNFTHPIPSGGSLPRQKAAGSPRDRATAASAPTTERVKLPKSPGFMVRRLHQVFVASFHQKLEPLGLTPAQFTLLSIVRVNPGMDQVSLAAEAVLDNSTVADVVRRMAERGLVKREAGVVDKRTRTVSLTPEGRKVLARAEILVHDTRTQLMAPLSGAELEQFLGLLERLLVAHEKGSSPWSRLIEPEKA